MAAAAAATTVLRKSFFVAPGRRFHSKQQSASFASGARRPITTARGASGKDNSGPGLWYVDADEANAQGEHPSNPQIPISKKAPPLPSRKDACVVLVSFAKTRERL